MFPLAEVVQCESWRFLKKKKESPAKPTRAASLFFHGGVINYPVCRDTQQSTVTYYFTQVLHSYVHVKTLGFSDELLQSPISKLLPFLERGTIT